MLKNITKGLITLAALLPLGYVFSVALTTPSYVTLEQASAASVQINKYCSGTVIQDPDLSDGEQFTVISAKHCLQEGETVGSPITVNVPRLIGNEYISDDPIETVVKKISDKSDLIILQSKEMSTNPVLPKIDIYRGFPKFGTHVFSLGYPLAESKVLDDGYLGVQVKIPPFAELSETQLFQKASTKINPGSSGGGLFVETRSGYQLLGVLTGMDRRSSNAAYYTPISEILDFIDGKDSDVRLG